MGKIIDEELARNTPCTCIQIGPTKEPEDLLCFSSGILGALTNLQDRSPEEGGFCTRRDIKPPSRKLKARLSRFQEAIDSAQERYEREKDKSWQEIVGEEMEKRGVRI